MKRKITMALLAAGCLMVPTCFDAETFGFGVNDVGVNVCHPGSGWLNLCADIDTPVDFNDLFNVGAD